MNFDFAKRAEYDNKVARQTLNPRPGIDFAVPVEGPRLDYLKDPKAWIDSYTGHLTEFTEDDHYLEYVTGLLEAIVNSSPYSGQDIYSPILLLEKVVTRKALMKCRDPMRTSLRLQCRLLEYAKIENDNNSIYDRSIEELELIPKKFALSLIKSCITPVEVIRLMQLDDESMFLDVLQSKNVELVASKMYQKVVWQTFWGSTAAMMSKKARSGRYTQSLYVAKRVAVFVFWNIFYIPVELLSREKRKSIKRRALFFSPFSSYLADLLNYSMMITFLLVVILITVPDDKIAPELLREIAEGNITTNRTDFRIDENKNVLIKLSHPEIPTAEWILWATIFARILTECYQAYSKKGDTVRAKLKMYFRSFYNVTDVFLVILLLTGMISKVFMSIKSRTFGVYALVDYNSSVRLVQNELILTIYFYCTGAVVALVHLLQVYTIHIPGLGPLILSAKRTFVEVSGLVFIYLFVIAGFLIPIVGMMTCYRIIHGIDGVDDENDFYYFASFGNAVITLVWTMFGGLDVEHRINLHRSRDNVTTVFVVILLVLYAIILGLLCMNLVIAIIVDVYGKVTSDKHADWRFSQFESIIDYSRGSNEGDGMPFVFPVCIPYIIYAMISQSKQKKEHQRKMRAARKKDNYFAKFLCEYRLSDD